MPSRASTLRHALLRRTLLPALLLLAAAAAAAPASLPPLVQPPSGEHHPGKVVFEQLVTPDLAAAERFYGGLYGWTFTDVPMNDAQAAEASLDGQAIALLISRPLPSSGPRNPAWLPFFSAGDVVAVANAALAQSAKLLQAPVDVPNLGSEAVLSDPQGAVFALLTSSSGDPPDVLPAPGAWIWASLLTRDPDADASFYQSMFNYDVFDLPGDQEAQHLLLADGNYARASINPLPPNQLRTRSHWLSFVRVTDMDATMAKITSLGGRIALKPQMDRQGGRIAVAADPAGAPFGLMEWNDDAPAGAVP